jgi:hypothetical protein
MIRVVNFRDRDNLPEPWFYVGREMLRLKIYGSAVGYRLGKDKTREQVIAKYKDWLWNEMRKTESEARSELYRLAARP